MFFFLAHTKFFLWCVLIYLKLAKGHPIVECDIFSHAFLCGDFILVCVCFCLGVKQELRMRFFLAFVFHFCVCGIFWGMVEGQFEYDFSLIIGFGFKIQLKAFTGFYQIHQIYLSRVSASGRWWWLWWCSGKMSWLSLLF